LSLRVVCFSTYLKTIAVQWRGVDHDAHDFVFAIKDRNINGYSNVRPRGQWHRFDDTDRQNVVNWFATMVADYFAANLGAQPTVPDDFVVGDSPIVLVAVFASKIDVQFAGTSRTVQLANAIQAAPDSISSLLMRCVGRNQCRQPMRKTARAIQPRCLRSWC